MSIRSAFDSMRTASGKLSGSVRGGPVNVRKQAAELNGPEGRGFSGPKSAESKAVFVRRSGRIVRTLATVNDLRNKEESK